MGLHRKKKRRGPLRLTPQLPHRECVQPAWPRRDGQPDRRAARSSFLVFFARRPRKTGPKNALQRRGIPPRDVTGWLAERGHSAWPVTGPAGSGVGLFGRVLGAARATRREQACARRTCSAPPLAASRSSGATDAAFPRADFGRRTRSVVGGAENQPPKALLFILR